MPDRCTDCESAMRCAHCGGPIGVIRKWLPSEPDRWAHVSLLRELFSWRHVAHPPAGVSP